MWYFACTAFELATGDMLSASMDGQGNSEDEAGCFFLKILALLEIGIIKLTHTEFLSSDKICA